MKKYVFPLIQRTILALVAMLIATVASAVNVTYRLTTNIDGRTLTETVQQNAGTAPKLPKSMIRGYTTYVYYDESYSTIVTSIPNTDCTIEVGYIFAPPFALADEYSIDNPTPYTVTISGSNFYHLDDDGYSRRYGTNGTRQNKYFSGDGYCLWIQSIGNVTSASTSGIGWVTWNAAGNQSVRVSIDERPAVGWQIIENTSENAFSTTQFSHFSLGTYVEGQNAPGNYMYHQQSNDGSSNTLSPLTIGDNGKVSNYSYSMCVYVGGNDGGSTFKYSITYHIIRAYPPYGQRVQFTKLLNTAVNVADPGKGQGSPNTQTKAIRDALNGAKQSGYTYQYYHDVSMVQPYGTNASYNESNPWMCAPGPTSNGGNGGKTANQNVVVWVLEIPDGSDLVTDHWTTLCLPYAIDNVSQALGGVIVNEFDKVEGSGDTYKLKFKAVDRIEARKPYLIKANEANRVQYAELFNPSADAGEPRITINAEAQGTKVSMVGTLNNKVLRYRNDNPYLFFMGYKTNDPNNDNYWKPAFYHIAETTPDRTIAARHAWFEIEDTEEGGGNAKAFRLVMEEEDGSSATGILQPDGTILPVANIYNMNGQVVRSNATGTDGLPKGLYIMDGKKFVVK